MLNDNKPELTVKNKKMRVIISNKFERERYCAEIFTNLNINRNLITILLNHQNNNIRRSS